MVDSIYRTRSLGVAAAGLRDQYADGKAAKVWELYIGCKNDRTSAYKDWILNHLKQRSCKTILDVACGTGIDSSMLVEEGYKVTSTDASDKMLKYALKERWERRKDERFDKWVIEEANWLNLEDDLDNAGVEEAGSGFDAVLCLGNSFAHLPDFEGNQSNHKLALANFASMVKPGGILMIDHRNYDAIIDLGVVPQGKNVYYQGDFIQDIKCSNLYVNGSPIMVTLDYTLDIEKIMSKSKEFAKMDFESASKNSKFRLSYYPHKLQRFTELLKEAFGPNCHHKVFADFVGLDEIKRPAYYIHIIQKGISD
ncbi:glycine N-methyltransferase-like [Tubulanus polymorphus]|uniref:glycine N-methyltransferase-like n=1 Tax=Tubulanus polymorphus TaxID=672921 RepID=UPI003DA5111C